SRDAASYRDQGREFLEAPGPDPGNLLKVFHCGEPTIILPPLDDGRCQDRTYPGQFLQLLSGGGVEVDRRCGLRPLPRLSAVAHLTLRLMNSAHDDLLACAQWCRQIQLGRVR